MKPLIDVLRERQKLNVAAFGDRYPWPVLIHRIRSPGGIDLSAETQFARPMTSGKLSVGGDLLSMGLASVKAHAHLSRSIGLLGASPSEAIIDGSIVIFLPGHPPGPDGLSIGRASDAAYSLPYQKISKVHAYLRERAGRWVVVDAGSRNGSQINGSPVPTASPMDLHEGTLLQFSQFQFLFYTAAGLYRMLGED